MDKTGDNTEQEATKKTRKDESTKIEKAYLENQVLFRVFQISCFRDWLVSLHSVT